MIIWWNSILGQLKLYYLMAECPDPTLIHLSPRLGIFPFNYISEEAKQCPVQGFLPKENLKAESPQLLQYSGLPSQGPELCIELATSPGRTWGRASPKEDRWAGWPQRQGFEQPFCFPAKQPAFPSHLPLLSSLHSPPCSPPCSILPLGWP